MITRTFAVLGLVMSIAQGFAAPQSVTTDSIATLSDSRDVRAALDAASQKLGELMLPLPASQRPS